MIFHRLGFGFLFRIPTSLNGAVSGLDQQVGYIFVPSEPIYVCFQFGILGIQLFGNFMNFLIITRGVLGVSFLYE